MKNWAILSKNQLVAQKSNSKIGFGNKNIKYIEGCLNKTALDFDNIVKPVKKGVRLKTEEDPGNQVPYKSTKN